MIESSPSCQVLQYFGSACKRCCGIVVCCQFCALDINKGWINSSSVDYTYFEIGGLLLHHYRIIPCGEQQSFSSPPSAMSPGHIHNPGRRERHGNIPQKGQQQRTQTAQRQPHKRHRQCRDPRAAEKQLQYRFSMQASFALIYCPMQAEGPQHTVVRTNRRWLI